MPTAGELFLSAQPAVTGSGILGCGSDGDGDGEAVAPHFAEIIWDGTSEHVFNKRLLPEQLGAWDVAVGAPARLADLSPEEWRLHRARKRGYGGGGLLCCRAPPWALARKYFAQYISAPDLGPRLLTMTGLFEKVEFNENIGSCILGQIAVMLLHQ